MTICLIIPTVMDWMISRRSCLSLWSAYVGLPCLSRSRIKIDEWMAKKGDKIKEEGIRGRETVVLFSLVWHYLSRLINPLRPSAWRSDENRGWERGGGCTWKDMSALRSWLLVGEGITLVPQTGPCFTCTICGFRSKCSGTYCSDLKSISTMHSPSSDLL